jgi:ABC-2 type transport system permease protein
LIVNEYVKILMKKSTVIMLIAVAVVAAGYNMIRFMEDRDRQSWMNSSYTYHQSYDDGIHWANSSAYEGWEVQVEILTYLRDNNVTQNHRDDDFWLQSVVYDMFYQEDQAFRDELEGIFKRKDWRAYQEVRIRFLEQTLAGFEERPGASFWESKESLEINLWQHRYRLEHNIPPFQSDWRNNALQSVVQSKYEAGMMKDAPPAEQDHSGIAAAEEAVLVGIYRLDNGIRVHTSKSDGITGGVGWDERLRFWDVFAASALGINVISVLIIIVAGSLISSEFSSGTVKYLLVNPVKRGKIFLSKYITVLTFAFVMLLLYYIFNVLLSGALFGFGDFGAPYLYVSGGEVVRGSSFLLVASKYLVGSIGMICMATLAFAISSVARSSALSIGLGVFLYLSGYGAVAIMSQLRLDFGRYIIFSNLELNAIAEGVSIYRGQTVPFALAVIGVYMLVFLLTAWDGFVRRDVK